jgi:hypothetical protein
MEELMKFTLLTRGRSDYLTDRYSEKAKESAAQLSEQAQPAQHIKSRDAGFFFRTAVLAVVKTVATRSQALSGVVSENGIYGHSRFCNTDFDDKLACLNLSGV